MNRKNERGMVLVIALTLAVLYFGLMELLLIDSSQALAEAQRFKARVIASTLAENGAELAAERMLIRGNYTLPTTKDGQGTMDGILTSSCAPNCGSGDTFTIVGWGVTTGVMEQSAKVTITGRIEGAKIMIDQSDHSQ